MKKDKVSRIKQKILIADDEESMRHILVRILGDKNYSIDTASDGQTALELWKKKYSKNQGYDLLLVDLKMPRLSGEEFIKEIRSQDQDVAIIVLSGHGDLQLACSLLSQFHISDFLQKPLEKTDRLLFSVENALKKNKLEQEIKQYNEVLIQINEQLYQEINHRNRLEIKLTKAKKQLETRCEENKEELEKTHLKLETEKAEKKQFLTKISDKIRHHISAISNDCQKLQKKAKNLSLADPFIQPIQHIQYNNGQVSSIVEELLDNK